jgi:hypothetical protein
MTIIQRQRRFWIGIRKPVSKIIKEMIKADIAVLHAFGERSVKGVCWLGGCQNLTSDYLKPAK